MQRLLQTALSLDRSWLDLMVSYAMYYSYMKGFKCRVGLDKPPFITVTS